MSKIPSGQYSEIQKNTTMASDTDFGQYIADSLRGRECGGRDLALGNENRKKSACASPIGTLVLETDGLTLKALRVASTADTYVQPCDNALVLSWLERYFSGREPDFLPPLELQGTPFQRRVWQELLRIPYGHTVTYGELARRIGCHSAQAVGQAVARNPIAVIVPCHRVVGANGLGGYAYGPDIKQKLLNLEKNT